MKMSHPWREASALSEMLQTPVGFAITWVTVTTEPSDSVDTARLVMRGGIETVDCPCESVVEITTGFENVDSGGTVTVLVCVEDCPFACCGARWGGEEAGGWLGVCNEKG